MNPRPNLLFIFTDQQRFDTMACYGNDWIETPNLNALADESFVFERAYVTQPVCTPARSSIMTGLYPHSNGCTALNIPLRPETPTIAEMVSNEYLCAYYGKWHLGDEIIAQHGFTDWVSVEDLYRQYYSNPEYLGQFSTYHHYLIENGFVPDVEREGERVFGRGLASRSLPTFRARARPAYCVAGRPWRATMSSSNGMDPTLAPSISTRTACLLKNGYASRDRGAPLSATEDGS